jgi:hypothetical protein
MRRDGYPALEAAIGAGAPRDRTAGAQASSST